MSTIVHRSIYCRRSSYHPIMFTNILLNLLPLFNYVHNCTSFSLTLSLNQFKAIIQLCPQLYIVQAIIEIVSTILYHSSGHSNYVHNCTSFSHCSRYRSNYVHNCISFNHRLSYQWNCVHNWTSFKLSFKLCLQLYVAQAIVQTVSTVVHRSIIVQAIVQIMSTIVHRTAYQRSSYRLVMSTIVHH